MAKSDAAVASEEEGYLYDSMQKCEKRGGGHVVKPAKYPTPAKPNSTDEPHQWLRCEHCGCWCYVPNHPVEGLKIIVPSRDGGKNPPVTAQ